MKKNLGDDILRSGRPIAKFVYGDDSPANLQQVYRLAKMRKLPVFWLGKTLCGRKSTLRSFVEEQERLSTAGLDEKAR